jgi:hypothetical protein
VFLQRLKIFATVSFSASCDCKDPGYLNVLVLMHEFIVITVLLMGSWPQHAVFEVSWLATSLILL